jgi:hypothetical protein
MQSDNLMYVSLYSRNSNCRLFEIDYRTTQSYYQNPWFCYTSYSTLAYVMLCLLFHLFNYTSLRFVSSIHHTWLLPDTLESPIKHAKVQAIASLMSIILDPRGPYNLPVMVDSFNLNSSISSQSPPYISKLLIAKGARIISPWFDTFISPWFDTFISPWFDMIVSSRCFCQ